MFRSMPRCPLFAGMLLLAVASVSQAQPVRRLPPTESQPKVSSHESLISTEEILPPQDYFREPPPPDIGPPVVPPVREFRLIQKVSGKATWLAAGGEDGLGLVEVDTSLTTVVPLIIYGSPLLVTPSFRGTAVDQPQGLGLPSELYRASVNIMWMKKVSDQLSYMVAVSPGVSSDFQATTDALRVFGMGAATYQYTPAIQFTFGAAFTGRDDIPVFPIAGMIWTPNEDWRVDVTLPRPRVSRRIYCLPNACTDDWVYFSAGLGGGTWAVERPSGEDDLLTFRDFRFMVGLEREAPNGMQGSIEVGYVFGRSIEFEDDPAEFDPTDTIMICSGLSF